jgi:DNA polymerase-3 subunit gamma/tau
LTGLWQQLIDAVGRVSPFTRGYLIDAHPVSFLKGTLIIGFDPEFEDHLGLVDNSRNHTLLATKLAELGHPNAMIKFVKADAPANWQRPVAAPVAAPAPKPATLTPKTPAAPGKPVESTPAPGADKKPAPISLNKEEFKNDPLIQKALEVFKGTIVEVRA